MTTPPSKPDTLVESLRLAYQQQVDNIREAKRLQWQVTYLGLAALGALVGAYQLFKIWNRPDLAIVASVLTVLGGLIATGAAVIIRRAGRALQKHRADVEQLADELSRSYPQLKGLLGVPPGYGSRRDDEPILLFLALAGGAGTLGWLLCGSVEVGLFVTLFSIVLAWMPSGWG